MIRNSVSFAFGDLRIDGAVNLTPAGRDIIKAVILHGIRRAERAETKARQMARVGVAELFGRQAEYYRHAGAFLRHMLGTLPIETLRLRDELLALRDVAEGGAYPAQWEDYLTLAAEMEQAHEPKVTSGEGSGASDIGERQPAAQPATPRRRGRPRKTNK